MTDLADELRVIAKDGGRLSPMDCQLIARAADELEQASAQVIRTQAQLIEAQQRRLAIAELLLEEKRKPRLTFTAPPLWRVGWGY